MMNFEFSRHQEQLSVFQITKKWKKSLFLIICGQIKGGSFWMNKGYIPNRKFLDDLKFTIEIIINKFGSGGGIKR